MNDWDNLDNLPTDDDNDDFDWLGDDSDDSDDLSWLTEPDSEVEEEDSGPQEWQMPRTDRAEKSIASQIEAAEDADFGNTDELLDWMQGSDEDGPAEGESVEDAWLSSMEGDAEGEVDDFLLGSPDEDEGEVDDFLLGPSDDEGEVDDFLFGTSEDDEGEDLFVPSDASESETSGWEDLADEDFDEEFFASTEPTGEDATDWEDLADEDFDEEFFASTEPTDQDATDWEDLAEEDFDEEFFASTEPTDEDTTDWDELPDDGGLDFLDVEEPVLEDEIDTGEPEIPDWLADMPEPEVLEPIAQTPTGTTDDDLGIPDWLAGAESDLEPDDDLDFMRDLEEPVAETEETGNDLGNLLGDIDHDVSDEELGDLLANLDTSDDGEDIDDLLATLDTGEEDEVELDDLLATLDTETAADDDLDSLLDDLGTGELIEDDEELLAPVADQTEIDDLDFLEPVQEGAGDLDFLASIMDSETGDLDTADSDFGEPVLDEEGVPDTGTLRFLDNMPESEPDWLDEISGIDTDALIAAAESAESKDSVDIDALIDSFDVDEAAYEDGDDIAPAADLDAIFKSLDDEQRSQLPDDLPAEALPEWLQEIAKGTDAASAAAIIRQRNDRSLDDLDERLLDLRDRGLEVSDADAGAPEDRERLAKLVPNIDEALSPARITRTQVGLTTEPVISPEQAQRVALLQGMVSSALAGETDTTATATGGSLIQGLIQRLDRILIALLLVAAVVAPFVYSEFDAISILPPGEFSAESPEAEAFNFIENLDRGDYVLIAAEYGATGARELDTATRSLMEHIATRSAVPVIVSSDAIGLLRAEGIAVDLLTEGARNQGYVVAGFLPGGNIGLRDLSTNLRTVVASDIRGGKTGLDVASIDDFAGIVLISESGETVRNWMEQVVPTANIPVIVVTGQAARPLALPYTSSSDNVIALLSGYDDAYTYQQMSLAIHNPSSELSEPETQPVTETSTPEPTATSTPEPTATDRPEATATEVDEEESAVAPVVTDEVEASPTAEATATSTVAATPTAEATATSTVTATLTAEATTTSTATATSTAEATPTEAEPEAELIEVAVIIADGSVNVRAGAGTSFAVVDTVANGDQLAIIDQADDAEWLNVILPDGSTGWIASELAQIEEIPEDEFEGLTEAIETVQVGTVVSDGRVNVRSGPGSDFNAIAGLDPGTRVRIIGTNDDGTWYNVVLPNGAEGWIADFLLDTNVIPASEWDGARKDGVFPIYYQGRPIRVAQADDDLIVVGRNAAGQAIPVYSDAEQTTVLLELANSAEFIVLEDTEPLMQILMDDGQIGYIESRVVITEERPRSDVEFAPTATPTATTTPTSTPTPFVPQITPAPLADPVTRSSSQALGLGVAIAVIALGNLFWIFRWLGQRES